MDYSLYDKVVFITGGAQGIGKKIVEIFSYERCKTVIADTNRDQGILLAKELSAQGNISLFIECDVSNAESVSNAVKKTCETFGTVHILVNNAGIGPPYLGKKIIEMPDNYFDIMISVHLKGTFLCTKHISPLMINQKWGRIVNIGSIHGISGGRPGLANYAAAKAGIEGFTKAASLELAPFGVTVNCVAPGFVKTAMLMITPEMEHLMTSQTPVGKLAKPEDIANTILFLSSDYASHITGTTLRVDGGRISYCLSKN